MTKNAVSLIINETYFDMALSEKNIKLLKGALNS